MDTNQPNKGGRPAKTGHKQYKVLLPEHVAEWAKKNGGLSELLRECLESRYHHTIMPDNQPTKK